MRISDWSSDVCSSDLIKRAQVDGVAGYPVFTRKPNTDVSYLACAARLLDAGDAIYPMFATHNAQTIAAVHRIAGDRDFEFQKLQGMGDDIYAEVIPAERLDVPCRVYAQVRSEEHTSELQSLTRIAYAVFCLK